MRSALTYASMVCVVLAACADRDAREPTGIPASADLRAAHGGKQPLYKVEHLGSLGGTSSRGNGINSRGWVAGYSNLAGNEIRRAALWKHGSVDELGTLGGPHSNVPGAGINNRGMVVGIAETDEPDPLGQAWSCTAFFFPLNPTGKICHGFFWERGTMKKLPTLGGYNGFAQAINNRGQVVGWAETGDADSTCSDVRTLGFKAVLWEPKRDRFKPLEPLRDHSASAATAINEWGQVVGISGDCDQAVGRFTARNVVLWDRDKVIDLGGLGGVSWNTPWDINEWGEVVGFGNPPGDDDGGFNGQAFYWNRFKGMHNLGALADNTNAQAQSINNRGQVVGVSFGGTGGQRAFYWERGDEELTDLNSLVVSSYTGVLIDAREILDNGKITGSALDANGEVVAFVATPVGRGRFHK
jgi:probable HAF family extracellular repeat protein